MKITEMKFQYFNQHQNLYITAEGENLIPKFEHIITTEPGAHVHYGINEYGVVNFGLWHDDPKKRPGHGGFWSSCESVVGPLIGKQLVEVVINRTKASMTVESLNEILPEDYHIAPIDMGRETYYEIQRKDGNNQETPHEEILAGNVPGYKVG